MVSDIARQGMQYMKKLYLSVLLGMFFDKKKYRYKPSPIGKKVVALLPNVSVQWDNGLTFVPPPDNFLWIKCSIRGSHEPMLEKILVRIVSGDMVVVDAGAQIGLISILCSKLLGSGGRVYAFEPHPENYSMLSAAIKANDATTVESVNMALGSREGRLFFWEALASGFTMLPDDRDSWPAEVSGVHEIECITLDHYLMANKIERVDILKIDVDGADFDVLMGAEGLLKSGQLSLVVFECSCYWSALGHECQTALTYLQEMGYDLYVSPISSDRLYKVLPGAIIPGGWGMALKKALNVYGIKNDGVRAKLAPLLDAAAPLPSLR